MTNQPTERLRSGRAPGRRGSGCGRGIGLGLLLLGLFATAAPIRAAEVVEVRVGRHPEFTRVVFELDRAAGYRIERSDPNSKTSELIISLEAGSIPRRIQSSKSFIETVVVEPNGPRSIARIRLARGGLRLKEMILASPPRIVLDVIAEKEGATTASTSTAAPGTSAAPAPKPPAPSIAPTPAPKPTAVVANAAPAPKPATPKTQSPAPQTRVLASTEDPDAKPPSPAPSLGGDAASADAIALALAAANAGADAGTDAPSEWNDGGAAGGSDGGSEPNAAANAAGGADARPPEPGAAEAPKARPMMVKSTKSEDEGGGLMTWALAGVGVAAVAFAGLVVARRRAAKAEGDEDEDADLASDDEDHEEESGEEDQEEESSSSASSNPFAELTGGSASLAAGTTRASASASRPAAKRANEPSESLLFDDAEEKTMEGMEVISRSQTNEALGGAMPMMGAGSDEITQMFREMQRRVAALEGRIDELVDARDRLERQVAAQTEELRVQRAAIARTQRAVRNLARPEEGNDDEPTEPALREPT